jgi:hypothetical protein
MVVATDKHRRANMKSNYLKNKVGGAVLGLSLLAGIGMASASTAQAQWPGDRNDQIRRTRTNDPWQVRRNRDYRNRRNNSGDDYPNYGGTFELRQTALNAGYNNGIEAGRRDRQRGRYYDISSQREFQRASKDYSSRLGDRNLYSEYFRLAFPRCYDAGYQGY